MSRRASVRRVSTRPHKWGRMIARSNFTGAEQPSLPWPLLPGTIFSFISYLTLSASVLLALVPSSPIFLFSYKSLSGYFLRRYGTTSDENPPQLYPQPLVSLPQTGEDSTCLHGMLREIGITFRVLATVWKYFAQSSTLRRLSWRCRSTMKCKARDTLEVRRICEKRRVSA